jgi:hypothetical protein
MVRNGLYKITTEMLDGADKADVLDGIESALSSFAQEHFAR